MSGATTTQSSVRPTSSLEAQLPFSLEALIGIVVGGVAVLFILCVACACCCYRRQKKKNGEGCTKHLDGGKPESEKNHYLNERVPAEIGTEGHVDKAKKRLKRGGKLSFKVKDVLTNTLVKQVENYTIEENRLTLGEVLGSGQFGIVYKAVMCDTKMQNPEDVAVKTMQGEECTRKEVQSFLEEVLVMRGFHHRNVLSIIGLSIMNDKPYAVLPFMHNGDLKTYIKDASKQFLVKDLLKMCSQVADGMAYLSEQRFIHRDLAARNCMVDKELVVKIADFGLSRDLFNDCYYRMESNTPMPVRWMALESLEDLSAPRFSQKSDVWSFGVLMWEVMTRGRNPYPNRDNHNVIEYVKCGGRPKKPDHLSQDVYIVMESCWKASSADRPTFSELSATLTSMLQGTGKSLPSYENISEKGRRK